MQRTKFATKLGTKVRFTLDENHYFKFQDEIQFFQYNNAEVSRFRKLS